MPYCLRYDIWSAPSLRAPALLPKLVRARVHPELLGLAVGGHALLEVGEALLRAEQRVRAQHAREPDVKHPRFIFKNLQYDSMHRLDLFTLPCAPAKLDAYLAKLKADGVAIDDANPWTAQRFVVGDVLNSFQCARLQLY